jgi:hypothetical protein
MAAERPTTSSQRWGVLLAVSAGLIACMSTNAADVPVVGGAPGEPAAKPVPVGLAAMGKLSFAYRSGDWPDQGFAGIGRLRDTFDGVAIGIPWDLLQPAPDKLDTAVIDQALAEVARYNAGARKPLWVRLRVFASQRAPDWAKKLGGDPVQVRAPNDDQPLRIGRFWEPAFRQAWRRLQDQLAARYDAHPLVRGVSISSCTSRGAEPFILPLDKDSTQSLKRAGFTDAAYERCLMEAVDDYAAWRLTPVDYTFNAYHHIDDRPRVDYAVTIAVMERFRRKLGSRAILMNHGLTYPPLDRAKPVHEAFKRLGPPVSMQMLAPDSSPWDAAITLAARELRADSVEIWPAAGRKFSGYEALPEGQLRNWSDRLRKASAERSAPAPKAP